MNGEKYLCIPFRLTVSSQCSEGRNWGWVNIHDKNGLRFHLWTFRFKDGIEGRENNNFTRFKYTHTQRNTSWQLEKLEITKKDDSTQGLEWMLLPSWQRQYKLFLKIKIKCNRVGCSYCQLTQEAQQNYIRYLVSASKSAHSRSTYIEKLFLCFEDRYFIEPGAGRGSNAGEVVTDTARNVGSF